MAFEPNNLRPIARNSTTGDIVWFYQTDGDAIATVTTEGYFVSTNTGLSFDDMILVSAANGAVVLMVDGIQTNGDIRTLGGRLTAADIAVDESLLPFIGGTVVAAEVQTALRRIHQRLNLKVQNVLSIGEGQTLFAGIDDSEDSNRKFRFRRITGADGITVSVNGDSIVIGGGVPGGGGGGGGPGSADGGDGKDPAFSTGLRRLHVAPGGQDPLDGTTPDASFTTIQAAINAAIAGDVITVRSGTYRETLTINNKAGTEAAPIWLVAEIRGGVRLARTVANADNGTAGIWTDEGGGVFSTALANRPYMGTHVRADGSADFLFPYLNEADLRATTITRFNTTTGGNTTATKPTWGMGFEDGRVFVRLRGNQNPNGQSIRLTNGFAGIQIDVNNSDFFILDGFIIEGAGDVRSIDVDTASATFTLRNCIHRLCRHGHAVPGGSLVETCTYEQQGFDLWYEELVRLSGRSINQCFMLFKGYYTAAAVTAENASGGGNATPGGGGGNALGEGSMEFGLSYGSNVQSNVIWDNCLFGPAFEGSRLGEFNNSRIRNSVFFRCRDDGVQIEGIVGSANGDRVHDCRFIDCFVDTSHQSDTITGNAHVFRCVFEHRTLAYSLPNRFSMKMIQTPPAASIFYYHNLWIVTVNNGTQQMWYPFSNGTANEINNFYNNIIIFEGATLGTPTTRPASIQNNVVVAATAGQAAFLTGDGGLYVGADDADMRLNADFSLQSNSPARNRGRALVAGNPDSRSGANANADCGPFPFGEIPGDDWPRPRTIIFNLNKPTRWPFD